MIITLSGFMGCGKSSVGKKLAKLLSCPFLDLDTVIVEQAGKDIPEIFSERGETGFRAMELNALSQVLDKYCPAEIALDESGIGNPEKPMTEDTLDESDIENPEKPTEEDASNHNDMETDGKHTNTSKEDGEDSAPRLILSLGGGTLTTPECAALVHQMTTCLYLRASIDTLVTNLKQSETGRPMLSGGLPLRERIEQLMKKRAAVYERTARYIVDIDGETPWGVARQIEEILKPNLF